MSSSDDPVCSECGDPVINIPHPSCEVTRLRAENERLQAVVDRMESNDAAGSDILDGIAWVATGTINFGTGAWTKGPGYLKVVDDE